MEATTNCRTWFICNKDSKTISTLHSLFTYTLWMLIRRFALKPGGEHDLAFQSYKWFNRQLMNFLKDEWSHHWMNATCLLIVNYRTCIRCEGINVLVGVKDAVSQAARDAPSYACCVVQKGQFERATEKEFTFHEHLVRVVDAER